MLKAEMGDLLWSLIGARNVGVPPGDLTKINKKRGFTLVNFTSLIMEALINTKK